MNLKLCCATSQTAAKIGKNDVWCWDSHGPPTTDLPEGTVNVAMKCHEATFSCPGDVGMRIEQPSKSIHLKTWNNMEQHGTASRCQVIVKLLTNGHWLIMAAMAHL